MRECTLRYPLLAGVIILAFVLALPHAGASALRGLESVDDTLIHFDPQRRAVGEVAGWGAGEGLRLRLSKSVYPYEDRHVDAVVFLDPQWGQRPTGRLRVELLDSAGALISTVEEQVVGSVLFFSYDFPDASDAEYMLRIRWRGRDGTDAVAEQKFRVAEPLGHAKSGRVEITIPNTSAVSMQAVPLTVGVPFPAGVLDDDANLRLVDAEGREYGLQTAVRSRWSRFGSVRWILADFTADLSGEPLQLYLEYGPDVVRASQESMRVVALESGFPAVDAGALRIDQHGVYYRFSGKEEREKVLPRSALRGGFVEHENGKVYVMPPDMTVEVEEQGPEKIVLLAKGWFQTADGREKFCQFVTRYVIHRDTPGMRIFHTWIFTGDGNKDRIFDMGWRFALEEGAEAVGFLPDFEPGTAWVSGEYLLQYDHNLYEIVGADQQLLFEGTRAPGVFAAALADGPGVVVGARDFWQNFPSELSFDGRAMTFHNWPKHGKPAGFHSQVDGFPGTKGAGWASEWLVNGVSEERLSEVFAIERHSEISPSSDTALTMTQVGSLRNVSLARQIETSPEFDLSQPHSVGFYLRVDDLAAMELDPGVWLRINSADNAFNINAKDHRWWVGARRESNGIYWQVRDGQRDNDAVRVVDTAIPLREGEVYYFQFDIDPKSSSYDFSLHQRGGESFAAQGLGFRGSDTTGGMFININQQKPADSDALDAPLAVSLSDIRIWNRSSQQSAHARARFAQGMSTDVRKIIPVHLWFAHSGEVLDFRMPEAFAEDPIYRQMSSNRSAEFHWAKGQPETANAQGVARTEELLLHFTPGKPGAVEAVDLYAGFNDETLRAVVDPAWVAASGAFYEIHHRDVEKYPQEERIFELIADAPARWTERLGLYGMWAYGDTMWGPNLNTQETSLYRAFRKGHQGWPYSWVPYARSGEPRLLRYADAATRQMTDVYYMHYFDEAVEESTGPDYFRQKGWWYRSLLPWTGRRGPVTRSYQSKVDFLWASYYLTGYGRAKDVVMDWAEQVKIEQELDHRGRFGAARPSITLLKAFVEMYQETYDPWFLIAAQEVAKMHQTVWDLPEASQWHVASNLRQRAGHFWATGDREYLRFTGDEAFRDYYIGYATAWSQPRNFAFGWPSHGAPLIEPAGYGYLVTGDEQFLQRMVHFLEFPQMATIDGGSEHFLGYYARDASTVGLPLFTGWYLQHFPHALAVLEAAGGYPDKVIPSPFYQLSSHIEEIEVDGRQRYVYKSPVVAMRKEAGVALPILLDVTGIGRRAGDQEMWSYRVWDADGAVTLEGEWFAGEETPVEVPASAPAGTYRLQVSAALPRISSGYGYRGLIVPVTAPGHPEVLELSPGEPMGRAAWESQYWFKVPAGVQQFTIEIPVEGQHLFARRMSVWNADGERVWNHQFETQDYAGDNPIRVTVDVPADQTERLWRLSLPGRNTGFTMDSQIPPVFSASKDRWFQP